jgi:signal transduction histidine kinase/FixJ family two-component response regulator
MTNTSTTATGALVLIASEDPDVRASLCDELVRSGAEVVVARSIIDAIAELHGAEFDLAIVDDALPPRGSHDVIRVAKELSPDTGVVVLLRPEQMHRTVECVRAGAFDFIRLPISEVEVGAAVGRALEHRRLRTTTAMFRASHAILVGTEVQKLPGVLVELAAELLACDAVCLLLRDGSGKLYVADSHRLGREDDSRELLELAEYATGGLDSASPLLLPDDVPRGREMLERCTRIRAALVCPMILGGRVGAILAAMRSADPRPFRRADAERAGVVASQIRLALENADLVQKTVAAQRLAAIGELAASVAHEINNPLVYVLANCETAGDELARLESADPRLREVEQMLADATEGAKRIRDIARDLRTVARADKVENFAVSDCVRSALRIAAMSLRGAVSVSVDLTDGAFVSGSAGRISQVFINLFVNAAQAAASCSHSVELRIETTSKDGRVVTTVRDNGPGIPAEHLARIFEPYFTTKSAANGTGLGLSISRSLVEDHGGTLRVTSQPGHGTTFVVDLPAAVQSARDADVELAATKRPRDSASSSTTTTTR